MLSLVVAVCSSPFDCCLTSYHTYTFVFWLNLDCADANYPGVYARVGSQVCGHVYCTQMDGMYEDDALNRDNMLYSYYPMQQCLKVLH